MVNSIPESHDLVAVVLSPDKPPSVVAVSGSEASASQVEIDGSTFVDSGAGDWLGFYDWLRNSEGQVVGVRQFVDEPESFPFERNFSGVDVDGVNHIVQIFFGEQHEFDESRSCDQNFGGNRLLVSADAMALTFFGGM